MKIAPMEAE